MFKSIQSESMIKNTHHFKSFKVNVSLPTKPTGPRKKQNIENCDLDQIPNHQKGCMMYTIFLRKQISECFIPAFIPAVNFLMGLGRLYFLPWHFFHEISWRFPWHFGSNQTSLYQLFWMEGIWKTSHWTLLLAIARCCFQIRFGHRNDETRQLCELLMAQLMEHFGILLFFVTRKNQTPSFYRKMRSKNGMWINLLRNPSISPFVLPCFPIFRPAWKTPGEQKHLGWGCPCESSAGIKQRWWDGSVVVSSNPYPWEPTGFHHF